MTLSNCCSSVKIEMDLSEPFDTVKVFRHGDPMWPLKLHHEKCTAKGGSALHWHYCSEKSVKLLTSADDIDIIGRTNRDVATAFSAIKRESTKMGLTVNDTKTKYMLSTSRYVLRINSRIIYIIGHYNPSVGIIDIVSHTTYVVCVNFMHKWRDLQFKVDSERQIFFEKLFLLLSEFLLEIFLFWCLLWSSQTLRPGARTLDIRVISRHTTSQSTA